MPLSSWLTWRSQEEEQTKVVSSPRARFSLPAQLSLSLPSSQERTTSVGPSASKRDVPIVSFTAAASPLAPPVFVHQQQPVAPFTEPRRRPTQRRSTFTTPKGKFKRTRDAQKSDQVRKSRMHSISRKSTNVKQRQAKALERMENRNMEKRRNSCVVPTSFATRSIDYDKLGRQSHLPVGLLLQQSNENKRAQETSPEQHASKRQRRLPPPPVPRYDVSAAMQRVNESLKVEASRTVLQIVPAPSSAMDVDYSAPPAAAEKYLQLTETADIEAASSFRESHYPRPTLAQDRLLSVTAPTAPQGASTEILDSLTTPSLVNCNLKRGDVPQAVTVLSKSDIQAVEAQATQYFGNRQPIVIFETEDDNVVSTIESKGPSIGWGGTLCGATLNAPNCHVCLAPLLKATDTECAACGSELADGGAALAVPAPSSGGGGGGAESAAPLPSSGSTFGATAEKTSDFSFGTKAAEESTAPVSSGGFVFGTKSEESNAPAAGEFSFGVKSDKSKPPAAAATGGFTFYAKSEESKAAPAAAIGGFSLSAKSEESKAPAAASTDFSFGAKSEESPPPPGVFSFGAKSEESKVEPAAATGGFVFRAIAEAATTPAPSAAAGISFGQKLEEPTTAISQSDGFTFGTKPVEAATPAFSFGKAPAKEHDKATPPVPPPTPPPPAQMETPTPTTSFVFRGSTAKVAATESATPASTFVFRGKTSDALVPPTLGASTVPAAPAFAPPAPVAFGVSVAPTPAAPSFGAPAPTAPGGSEFSFRRDNKPPPAAAPAGLSFGNSTPVPPAPVPPTATASGTFHFGNTAPAPVAPAPFGQQAAPLSQPFGGNGSASGMSFGSTPSAPAAFGAPAPGTQQFGSAPAPFGAPAPAPGTQHFGNAPPPFGAPAPSSQQFGNAPAPPAQFGNQVQPFGNVAPAASFPAAPVPAASSFGAPSPAFGVPTAPSFNAPAPTPSFAATPTTSFGAGGGGGDGGFALGQANTTNRRRIVRARRPRRA